MFERQLAQYFLKTVSAIECGRVTVTMPDGKTHEFEGKVPGVHADLTIHSMRTILNFAQKGDIGFAESYRDGGCDSSDLSKLFIFCLQNDAALKGYMYGNFLTRIASRVSYFFNRNTVNGSKKNIHAHYDLGNEFYSLWLDPTMTYSSALFASESDSLLDAQNRKYDRIIERLDSSGKLLEIGCGWGGFAERAITTRDYAIKGLTISDEQYDYANKRLKGEAVISLEDYRIQQGKYDQIVSIEMFEAVGEQFWPVYFGQVKALLADKGKAVIQTITIEDQHFERYRKGGDSIRTFIFPGGMLPSSERFAKASQNAGLTVTDQFSFGRDYALTLKYWLEQFEQKRDQIMALGFDEKFVRMWRFYLAFCIASFTTGRTNVMQMELQHAA